MLFSRLCLAKHGWYLYRNVYKVEFSSRSMEKITKDRIIRGLAGLALSAGLAFLTLGSPFEKTHYDNIKMIGIMDSHKYNPNPSIKPISDNPHHYIVK